MFIEWIIHNEMLQFQESYLNERFVKMFAKKYW